MYATVFVRLSTQGAKKTGALIEISKIQTFYLSETVSNTELPLKLCFRFENHGEDSKYGCLSAKIKVVIYDDFRGRLFMFCW